MSDLGLYYSGTVNIAEGEICYIGRETKDGLICRPLKGGKSFVTKNVSPINNKLFGYINTPRGAVLISRRPSRCAKEGLSMDNCDGADAVNSYPYEVYEMLKGEYPSYDEAKRYAAILHSAVAISPTKTVWMDGRVYNIFGQPVDRPRKYRIKRSKKEK